ncbi:MAG: leucine-rich repeat protein [Muribaculaceae bacterium]|nr:leucine-rich repeat protein [Muribaculaceae bacterium]
MKHISERFRFTLIAVVALMIGYGTSYAYDFSANGIYYNINNATGTVEVTFADNSYNSYSGNVVIPASVSYNSRSYKVTAVGDNAFRNCGELTAVTLGKNIATIGKRAFLNCSLLTTIDIKAAVTVIDDYAFAQCGGLKTVTFNNNAPIEMGTGAFLRCSQLANVKWPSAETLDGRGGLSTIGTNAFAHCTALTKIFLPGDLQLMGSSIFEGCQNLSDITLTKDTPLALSGDPFALNGSSVTIHVPSSGTEGETASLYSNAVGWRDYNIVELPYSFIDNNQFTYLKNSSNTVNLTGCQAAGKEIVEVRNSITDCGGTTYNVAGIADEAFKGKVIKTLDTSNARKLKSIGDEAFANCTQLTNVTLREGISSMGTRAFAGCTALTSIQVPSTLRAIPTGAFENCSQLSDVNLVMGVANICENAFAQCTSLKTIALPRSTYLVEIHAFRGTTSLEQINVDSLCNQYASFDGVLFERKHGEGFEANEIGKMYKLVLYPMCKASEEYFIPYGVAIINNNALEGASHLKHLAIPASTTTFGSECFNGTDIETINYRNTDPSNDNTDGITEALKANAVLQVPVGTILKYTALTSWQGFKNIVEIDYMFQDGKYAYDLNPSHQATIVDIYPEAINSGELIIPSTTTISGYTYYITELKNNCTEHISQLATALVINADSLSVIDMTDNINPISTLHKLKSISVISSNPYFKISNNILYNKRGDKLYYYLRIKSLPYFNVPNNVETIMPGAFAGNIYLTQVTLNNMVRRLEGTSFEGCPKLQYIYHATKITYIGPRAFAGCPLLKSFNGGENLNEISDEAFLNCSSLQNFPFAHGMLKSIGDRAFKGCSSINTVIMGFNLTKIGDGVFEDCSSLNKVFFSSEIEHFGTQVFKGCNSLNELWLCNNIPPEVDSEFFAQPNLSSIQLFVPKNNVANYYSTYPWNTALAINSNTFLFNGADVNNDNVVNALDITLVMSELLGMSNGDIVAHYDVNRDGTVNAADITVIYNYLLNGINVSMPFNFVNEDQSNIKSTINLNDGPIIIQPKKQSNTPSADLQLAAYVDNTSIATYTLGIKEDGTHFIKITPLSTGHFTLVAVVSDGTTCYYRALPMVVIE